MTTRITVNPKAKCPKCGTFMTFVGKTRAWGNKYQCSKCGFKRFTKAVKPWQKVTEANLIGGKMRNSIWSEAGLRKPTITEAKKLVSEGGTETALRILTREGYLRHAKGLPLRAKDITEYPRLTNPNRGGNPMAKKKRTRKMKVFGIPVITVAIIGGLVWWFTRNA